MQEAPIKLTSAQNAIWHLRTYRIPYNMDLPAMLKEAGEDPFWLTDRGMECLLFIISYILRKYFKWEAELGYFVPISSTLLRERFGKSPRINGKRFYLNVPAIAVLERLGIIKVNSSYSNRENGFSKSYALTKKYCTEIYQIISFTPKVSGKITKESVREIVALNNPQENYINTCLNQLEINEEALSDLLNSEITEKTRGMIQWASDDVRFKEWGVCSGKNQKRIYHSLTNCPKEFRQVVTLNGDFLIEADIKSCQPVLLLAICPEEEKAILRGKLTDDIYTSLGGGNRDKAKEDFLNFAFMDYQKEGKEKTWEQFLKRANESEFGTNFLKTFPLLSETIFNFSGLACFLQNLEAEIIIYSVLPKLMERNIWAVTIHDSFLIKEIDFPVVEKLLKDEFLKRFNFNVIVKNKSMKNKEELEPDYLWKNISGFETVRECVEITGEADYYVGDYVWVSPCGKMETNLIYCSCGICRPTAKKPA